MAEQKKSRIIWKILGICAVLALIFGGICIWGVKRYIDRVPRITPYENLSFTQGSELLPIDLAEITVADKSTFVTKRIIDAKWADGTYDELAISENGEVLRVGDKTGALCVWVQATGVEAREAECVVRITE